MVDQMFVGATGACAYHGLTFFDISSVLLHQTPIQSAVLYMYTPDGSGPTGVQVYPNVRAPSSTSWLPPYSPSQPPSWNTAPAVVPGVAGIPQSGSDGHWQSWDITGLASQWLQNRNTNGGITLAGDGNLVRFSSPMDESGQQFAPYLAVTYGPLPNLPWSDSLYSTSTGGLAPNYYDGLRTTYGLAGQFALDGSCFATACGGQTGMTTVENTLGASYVRFSVKLSCTSAAPGTSWWNGGNPDHVQMYNIEQNAYSDYVIPIINFEEDYSCGGVSTSFWASEVADYVNNLPAFWLGGGILMYFEIGNEPNVHTTEDYANFTTYFGAAAKSLNAALAARGLYNYRILTGGVLEPTTESACDTFNGISNFSYMWGAIYSAEQNSLGKTDGVSSSHLGIGLHPYGYLTNQSQYWKNYRDYAGLTFTSCVDLAGMISLWFNEPLFANMPFVSTETNWSADPNNTNPGINLDTAIDERAYLVDLFSWYDDNGYADPTKSPSRVMWYQGADTPPRYLGLYRFDGGEKYPYLSYCPYQNLSNQPQSYVYARLLTYTCY